MIKPKEIVDEIVNSLLKEYPEPNLSKIDIDDFWEEAWDRTVDELAENGIALNSKTPPFPPFVKKEHGPMLAKIKEHLVEKIESQIGSRKSTKPAKP